MENSNKKQPVAFLTGITGMDGANLSTFLLNKGYKVIGLRRRTSTFNTERVEEHYANPEFIMEWGNLNDIASLWRIISLYQPDEIYHLGAQSHVAVSFKVPEETLDVVAKGTLNLLNVCKELCPNVKIYNAGSSEMFGDNPKHPQNEQTRFMPASPYACAKVYAFNICRNYREAYNMFITNGILFNHEHPYRGETFVTRKITQAAARIKLGLQDKIALGNLDAKRDWGYSPDFVEGMWMMLQQDKPDDFVLATNETHTVREFLEEVFYHADLDPYEHLEIDEKYMRPHEVPCLLGDYSKAKRELGWEPKVKFKELAKIMYFSDLRDQAKKHNISLIDENHPGKEMNKFEKLLKRFDF